MRYARIDDGSVVEIIETDGDVTQKFHPALQFVAASGETAIGWMVVDDELVPPPPPPPPTKPDLIAYAANARWRKEVGGIVVSGVPVATDDRSKQMILGARLAAEADSGFTTPWIGSDGSVNLLTAAQIIAISDAVLAHVAGCFATFADLQSDIMAGVVTTREQVDAAFAD